MCDVHWGSDSSGSSTDDIGIDNVLHCREGETICNYFIYVNS